MSKERALMWRAIVDHDLNVIKWVLVGNFNMIKDGHRKNAVGHNFMKRWKVVIWHNMTLSWGLRDAWTLDNFHKTSAKSFTFDNGRIGIQSIVSQLDMCYVLTKLDELGGRIGVPTSLWNNDGGKPISTIEWTK
jgi:hypothetical protein